MKYLYHGSATQNLKTLEPRKRFTPNGQIDYSAIYATPSAGFAGTHAFPWQTKEGFDLNVADNKIIFTIPENQKDRLNIPISIYKITDENFEVTKEETTGYTWRTTKPAEVLEEEKYEGVLDAFEKLGVEIKFK